MQMRNDEAVGSIGCVDEAMERSHAECASTKRLGANYASSALDVLLRTHGWSQERLIS